MPRYFPGDGTGLRFFCFPGLALHFLSSLPITLKKAGFHNEVRMDNFQKDIDDRANLTLSNRFELL
ncbi:hypothetical protein BIW90_25725, partial [Salmonella enterica]|nr:hypothetical protein [Salmonella enterica]